MKTTVAQLQMRGGMAYVIRLCDGRFIIIDGGEAATEKRYQMNKKVLYSYLKNNTADGKICVACWIITHFHSDHVDVAERLLREHQDDFAVERFLYNYVPTVQYFPADGQKEELSREKAWAASMDCYPKAERICPNAGDSLQIADVNVQILATANDPYPANATNPNFISMVLKLVFDSGKSFLLLGDAMARRLTALVDANASIYQSAQTLKSDILQTAHHGLCVTEDIEEYPAVLRLYQQIAPSIVFWPQNEQRFFADPWCRAEKHTYHQFLFATAGKNNYNQSYTTIVDMADLSITFERVFDEAD